jgi:hypothetical protein
MSRPSNTTLLTSARLCLKNGSPSVVAPPAAPTLRSAVSVPHLQASPALVLSVAPRRRDVLLLVARLAFSTSIKDPCESPDPWPHARDLPPLLLVLLLQS